MLRFLLLLEKTPFLLLILAELSLVRARVAEHHRYEKMVTYGFEKFWQPRDRPYVLLHLTRKPVSVSHLPPAQPPALY